MPPLLKKTSCVELAKGIKIDGDIDAAWTKLHLYFVADIKEGVKSVLSELEELADENTKKTILELKNVLESNNRFTRVLMHTWNAIVLSDDFENYLENSLKDTRDRVEVMKKMEKYWQKKEKEFKRKYKAIKAREDNTLFIRFVSADPKDLLEAIKIIKGKIEIRPILQR